MNPPFPRDGRVRRTVFLKPAEIFVSGPDGVPGRVTTILGSCVSVTFFSPRLRLGAICHALLPRCPRPAACRTRCADHARYAACVLPALLGRLRSRGLGPSDLVCGLFGGSDLFGVNGRSAVGRANAETALEFLEAARMRIVARDVGGRAGRKLVFDTDSGDIWLRPVRGIGQREIEASWKKF